MGTLSAGAYRPSGTALLGPAPPNKRLKLAGARKQGRIALPPSLASLSTAPPPCAGGDCARSLSAIR
jgi:hypothetical protein